MKTSLVLTTCYLLFIPAFLLAATFLGVRRIPDASQPQIDQIRAVKKGFPVSETIIPAHNGLSTLLIWLKNASLANTDTFKFTLKDTTGTPLREITLSGANIGDGDTVRFQFPPLPDSRGQTYLITLDSTTVSESAAVKAGFSAEGRLAYQSFYHPQSPADSWADLVSQLAPKFSPRFLIIFFLVLLGSISLVNASQFGRTRTLGDQ